MTQLNPEQLLVVQHDTGPLRVGAVAGSGKSTAIVERVAYLIERRHVPVHRILAIAFSKDACTQLQKRLNKRLPAVGADKCARTFHSIGLEVYTREIDPNREKVIDSTGILYIKALTSAYKSLGLKPERKAATRFAGLAKNNLLSGDEGLRRLGKVDPKLYALAEECAKDAAVTGEDIVRAFFKAERVRTHEGVATPNGEICRFVTFDDMIYETALILRHKDVGERWGDRWLYVMQDEGQDENVAQAQIAEVLCRKHRNYVVVGDPSQSLYKFRGASPERILKFHEEWPGAKTIMMFRNYRSGIEIVDLANRIIDHMPASTVITDEMGNAVAMTSERKTHAYVGYHAFEDSRAEANAVVENMIAHHRAGVPWAAQAVLLRMNRMTRDIEIALATRGVPYRMVSGSSFFGMREAKILFGYLRMVLDTGTEDDARHAIMYPSRGLGRVVVDAVAKAKPQDGTWLDAARAAKRTLGISQARRLDEWVSFIEGRQRNRDTVEPKRFMQLLRDALHLDDWFKREVDDAEDSRASQNLDAVIEFAAQFDTLASMAAAISKVSAHQQAHAKKRKAVMVSTVHKAKGAEWSVVYLVQLAHGRFPTTMGDTAEERRVFYVACTRAKDELWISRPQVNDDGEGLTESLFAHEVGLVLSDSFVPGPAVDTATPVGTQIGLNI